MQSLTHEMKSPVAGIRGAAELLYEEFLLETAISNLLQNAIDFSPAGARIALRLSTTEGAVQLLIEDSGIGIPDYALDQIFDRFYSLPRPGAERKSSGLGLCFVREAVALHGGHMVVANRRGTKGVRAELVLPLGAH